MRDKYAKERASRKPVPSPVTDPTADPTAAPKEEAKPEKPSPVKPTTYEERKAAGVSMMSGVPTKEYLAMTAEEKAKQDNKSLARQFPGGPEDKQIKAADADAKKVAEENRPVGEPNKFTKVMNKYKDKKDAAGKPWAEEGKWTPNSDDEYKVTDEDRAAAVKDRFSHGTDQEKADRFLKEREATKGDISKTSSPLDGTPDTRSIGDKTTVKGGRVMETTRSGTPVKNVMAPPRDTSHDDDTWTKVVKKGPLVKTGPPKREGAVPADQLVGGKGTNPGRKPGEKNKGFWKNRQDDWDKIMTQASVLPGVKKPKK